MLLEDDGPNGNWTWLHSSRSHPVSLGTEGWPDGLPKSVERRNSARYGQEKGRVLIVRSGPHGNRAALSPVAVMFWHAHQGNWPLSVLDLGYRIDADAARGRAWVEETLLSALADLNDRKVLRDRKVPRPTDRLGWAVQRQDGAGSDPSWARRVATRAQVEWDFQTVRPKSARPRWARDGFYGERRR